MFRKLCGDEALGKVVLGCTKWGDIPPDVAEQRQTQLMTGYWKELIENGSEVYACRDTTSPQAVLDIILSKIEDSCSGEGVGAGQNHWANDAIQIQQELIDLDKYIPETAAGQELRFTFKQYLEMVKEKVEDDDPQAKEALKRKLQEQLKALQLPLSVRILTSLGLRNRATVANA